MSDPQVVDYIKKARAAGMKDEDIRFNLFQNGWSEQEINENLLSVGLEDRPASQPEIGQTKPQQQTQPAHQFKPARSPILKLIIILIILVLAAAGVTAWLLASQVFDPNWNPFAPKPETVLLKAWENLGSVKSESFYMELSAASKNLEANGISGKFDIGLRASGSVDNPNKLADITMSAEASFANDVFSLTGEIRSAQNNLYIKLDELNLAGLEDFLLLYGIDIAKIQGQWVRIEGSVLTAQVSQGLSQQPDLDSLFKLLLKNKAFDIKRLPDNKGSNGKEYRYYISLSHAKLIEAFRATLIDSFLINSFFNKVGNISATVLIGKKDNFFHEIQFVKDFDLNKLNAEYVGDLRVNYKVNQTGINKPVQISIPVDYIDFSNIAPSKLESDMNSLKYTAQSIFSAENSYSTLCNKGLLNGYQKDFGESLITLNNDIIKQGAKKPVCFSSAVAYCISTELADGSFLCAGKSDNLGKTKCLSVSTICE